MAAIRTEIDTEAAAMRRILIVDDESAVCQTVSAIVAGEGFQPDVAVNPSLARKMLEHDYSLVILDIVFPEENGLDLLEWLKDEQRRSVPVIILSAITRQDTKVRAFELGADDYITKPFSPRELAARIQAIVRRRNSSNVINFGPYRLDLTARALHRGNKQVHLRPKEFDILATLAQHPGEAMGVPEIVQEVWGDKPLAARQAVAVAIHSLRSKLENDIQRPDYIRTVNRFGYRFEPGE